MSLPLTRMGLLLCEVLCQPLQETLQFGGESEIETNVTALDNNIIMSVVLMDLHGFVDYDISVQDYIR